MKAKSRKQKYLALTFGMVAITILGYLWKTLGGRGIYADETGTSGYTTGPEIFLAGAGVSLLVVAIVLLTKSICVSLE